MAGILDSKTRVIDTVITQEGKRQIADGGLRPVFATVSDRHTYYEKDINSGSSDATRRVYYEPAINNINDSIIMESDDSGQLLGYPVQGSEYFSQDGSIFQKENIKSQTTYQPITQESAFASAADTVIGSAIERFKNLQTIGTRDPDESLDLQMKITPQKYKFTINNKFPFSEGPIGAKTNLDWIQPLFFDEMLSDSINFKYLPPITSQLTEVENNQLKFGRVPEAKRFGTYTKFQRPRPMKLEDIMRHLNVPEIDESSSSESISYDPDSDYDITPEDVLFVPSPPGDFYPAIKALRGPIDEQFYNPGLEYSQENSTSVNLTTAQLQKERVSVFFRPTSSTNNIIMQMFEVDSRGSRLKKLDVIHYGEFNTSNQKNHPRKNVFFAGKIFINSIGLPTFVNLFTIIMD